MKIAIDASQIIYGTGVSVYTKNLIRALLKIDKENKYLLIGGSLRRINELNSQIEGLIKGNRQADKIVYPIPPAVSDMLLNRFGFINIDPFIGKSDIFHSSDWTQPTTSAYKVTTIHDLVPILYSKISDPKIVDVHRRRLAKVKKYVDCIIVPSKTTKDDLEKLGFKQDRIFVIPEATDPEFVKPSLDEAEAIKRKYRLKDRYLLAVGTSPRKNLSRIITAFEKIRVDRSLKLVVLGEAKNTHNIRNVSFLGHIPYSEVPVIYSEAEALIYPSLYEGFGLPILEAFKVGLPVLTSNLGSMKELAENAAVLVDPTSEEAIGEGIKKLLSNREIYIKSGKKEIKKYSWEKTAQMTLDIYKKSMN